MIIDPIVLRNLRDAEPIKWLVIVGVLAVVYGTGWMVFDHHATRIGESEGTVSRIYQDLWYTVDHVYKGVEYNASPPRIPDSLGRPPVGSTVRIYFYRNDPARAFWEPRRHPSPQPIAAAVVILGLAALGEALRRALRLKSRPAESSDILVIPISELHWFRAVAGGVFAVLLLVVIVLSMHLSWEIGGPMGLASLVFIVLIHGGLILSIFAIGYVNDLVFDPGRDLVYDRWGLWRAYLFTYRPLSDLVRLETRRLIGRRGMPFYRLVLHFKNGSEMMQAPDYDRDNPSAPEQRIREWLESRSIKLSG